MIGKPYFLLTLLQAVVSQEWRADYKPDVTVQRGLCARIPCRYHYPSYLVNEPRVGIWKYNKIIVFHSGGPSRASARFRHRTRLSGDLRDDDCSLVINDIMQEDDGPYYFRVEFDGSGRYNFRPGTQLHVSDFTDKPSIFPAEIVAGEPVNVICTFNTTCDGTAPKLTWVIPADVPPAAPSSVTRRGDTLTYTSVLTLTPALKHHGQNLTCRVTYPSVSSEQTLTLTVEYGPRNLSISSPDVEDRSSISIMAGNSTAILCSVQSSPASNLTWRHRGVTLNRTRSRNELWLEFPQVTPGLAGVYQCVAENDHGTEERAVTLAVEHAPVNLSFSSPDNVDNSSIGIKEGNSVAILCSVQSFPASNLTWRHRGVTLNRTSSRNELWLEFPQMTPGLAGVYQCVAENEHGTAERAVTLTVEYKPEISGESGCTRSPEAVSCVCAARSYPPGELTWHLPLANLSGNQTLGCFQTWLVADGQLVTSRLTLTRGDGGEDVTVWCTIQNQHGEATFKVYLWVKDGGFSMWLAVLLTAIIIIGVLLTGFFIYKCIEKRQAATKEKEKATEFQDIPPGHRAGTQQGTSGQGKTETPPKQQGVAAGLDVGQKGQTDPVYANLEELPSSGGTTIQTSQNTEYAELRFR